MRVLDASAAVDLLVGTDRAAAVAQALRLGGELHAPELIDPEVVSAYAAFYVALAEALGAELLTTDTRLAAAARGLVGVAE